MKVEWSARYQSWALVHDNGRQAFHGERPLVFYTEATAMDYLNHGGHCEPDEHMPRITKRDAQREARAMIRDGRKDN